MDIYHLHSYKQIGQDKNYTGECIRFLLEDDIYAEENNLDFLDLNYGMTSRYDLRSKIYPDFMTYRKWIELSEKYSALILSINFDSFDWRYKEFVKKVLGYFPQNKKIIVAAGNEVFEKRGSIEGVYQVTKMVHDAMIEIGKFYPIVFWNQKIRTTSEKLAVERIFDDRRFKDICKYFGFQSLETTQNTMKEFIWLAKFLGYKVIDIELGTITDGYSEIKTKFDLDIKLGIEDIVVMGPEVHKKILKISKIWGDYALKFTDGTIKDKTKLLEYIKQFKTKEEGMKIADKYKLNDKGDKVIDWIQAQLFYRGFLVKPINYGTFDTKTEQAVKAWQATQENIVISGVITKFHIFALVKQASNPQEAMWNLQIYSS